MFSFFFSTVMKVALFEGVKCLCTVARLMTVRKEKRRVTRLYANKQKSKRLKIVSGVAGENKNNKKRQTPY